MSFITKLLGDHSAKELKKINPICDKVLNLEAEYASLSDEDLKNKTTEFKKRLNNGETLDDILPEAFAACREASSRVLGMKHYPVQIIGGITLHQGRIAEMRTGEGKTLVETLPAYLNALTGNGVHIVTVNDYLAKRDSEQMSKIYSFLGLTTGLIAPDKSPEERQKAYAADITYGTNNEFGFDYLRDNMATDKRLRVQRGHAFAIVDEVDSILIDEARTPLIISGRGNKTNELYIMADKFASSLKYVKIKEVEKGFDAEDMIDDDCDCVVDEKRRVVTLTQSGIKKAESFFNINNYSDEENLTIRHHINQAVKARGIMIKNINYVVKDGEVLIVDEFTGRTMPGRRYNEGLHQAIEAKEGIEVKNESVTLATITFQNYFRLYGKLSGMTGTAKTEEEEFRQIYNLDIITIPTNKPVIRTDYPDVVYKTEKAKYDAVIEKIIDCHTKGRPVLVGTSSIEKSEYLSKLLKERNIQHNVLNAKNHEKEAEIVAQAGTVNAVTIATNMAGRGTDIKLGGNSEFLAREEMSTAGFADEIIEAATGYAETDDETILCAREFYKKSEFENKVDCDNEADLVRALGGLFVIGTERHESRRIDNQLRGRAGRQGDPGASQFFVSLEDDLMRLFGGAKITSLMNSLNTPDDLPVEAKVLSNAIENSQKNIESKHFQARKSVLEFDDVVNVQRNLIYEQRNRVLDESDVSDIIMNMIETSIENAVNNFCNKSVSKKNWNIKALKIKLRSWGLTEEEDFTEEVPDADEIKEILFERAVKRYEERERLFGKEEMRILERKLLLHNVDRLWVDHIDAMDHLKTDVALKTYAQSNPITEYRNIGSEMFNYMSEEIRESTARQVLTVIPKPKKPAVILKVGNKSGGLSIGVKEKQD